MRVSFWDYALRAIFGISASMVGVCFFVLPNMCQVCFGAELAGCADTGLLSMSLYAPMRQVAARWTGTIQKFEGLNSLILAACARAPRS
eukprot:4171687-Alexandrium_andersonii.AAC.1